MRLIDADEIPWCNYDLDNYHSFIGVEKEYVDEIPTVDAKLVQHGKWVDAGKLVSSYKCTVCNTIYENDSNYCPNCGAEMER